MIWTTEPFAEAHAQLASARGDVPAIESIIDPIKSDLQQLLKTPPKSEESRKKLATKSISIDGNEFEVNEAFLNDTARVADELNLDEIEAAKLVFYALPDATRLNISVLESALTLFYVRRRYILDIVRFALENFPTDKFGEVLGNGGSANTNTTGNKRLVHILDALKSVEQNMERLEDTAKSGEFTGLSQNPQFTQVIKLQKEFLIAEHEALGTVLFTYFDAAAASTGSKDFADSALALFNHLATFETLDTRVVSYFPALVCWLSSSQHSDNEFFIPIYKYFVSGGATWKLGGWQSALALVVYTTLADEERQTSIELKDLMSAMRSAIDASALEFWLAIAQDVNSSALGDSYFDKFRPLVRSRVPQFSFWKPIPSEATLVNLQSSFEVFATRFIQNAADILKEMRLSEEDMYLAMNELNDGMSAPSGAAAATGATAISPGVDFERFLLFVAITCRNHPETSELFLEDEGDALYGFLVWATDCQVTFMSAAFTELIGSLANDSVTSKMVNTFLLNPKPSGEDSFVLSWNSIVDVIDYYIRGMSYTPRIDGTAAVPGLVSEPNHMPTYSTVLTSSNGLVVNNNGSVAMPTAAVPSMPGTAAVAPIAVSNGDLTSGGAARAVQWGLPDSAPTHTHMSTGTPQPSQLSDDSLLILSAYMNLISRVASQSEDARTYLHSSRAGQRSEAGESRGGSTTTSGNGSEGGELIPLLLKLLKLKQPITGPILNALSPFATPEIWSSLDTILVGKFDEFLLSQLDTLALVQLVEKFVAKFGSLSPKIDEYTNFITRMILPWTTKPENESNVKTQIQLHAISYLRHLVVGAPPANRGQIADANHASHDHGTVSNGTANSGAASQIAAFKACFSCCDSIFQIISTGVDKINALEPSHPLVQSVTASVELVVQLVLLSVTPSQSFDKPVLYHLQIVPHLALYAGCLHPELSLASIRLLTILEDSVEFRATVDRQSRVLSILSSTTESTRIRVGLMARLEDAGASVDVQIAMLEMLLHQLRHNGEQSMTVAHYLLGFTKSELGLELKLELDTGIGGVASGSSLLSAVCQLLLTSLYDSATISGGTTNGKLLKLTSEIILFLVQDSLTSEMVLDFLRKYDFWLATIKAEPLQLTAAHDDDFLDHRASMLEIWIREVQLCHKRLLLTVESHYIQAIVPNVFTLVNFTSEAPRNQVSFRCLKAWCKLIPVLIESGDETTGAAFISCTMQLLVTRLSDYSRQNAEFAVPISSLLVFLFDKYQQKGVDDCMIRHMCALFRSALESLQPAQANTELRCNLYTLCFQHLRLVAAAGASSTSTSRTEQSHNETLATLVRCGPKIFQIACDDILGFADEALRMGALLFIQLSLNISSSATATATANATANAARNATFVVDVLLQYNFVSVFVSQVLCPILNGHHANLQLNSKDTSSAQRALRVVKVSLSLLLPIARTRPGAAEILATDFLKTIDNQFSTLSNEVLALAIQLLAVIVVSMGAENTIVSSEVRGLLSRHKSRVEQALRRDAALDHALHDESAETEVGHLAKGFTVLMSLV